MATRGDKKKEDNLMQHLDPTHPGTPEKRADLTPGGDAAQDTEDDTTQDTAPGVALEEIESVPTGWTEDVKLADVKLGDTIKCFGHDYNCIHDDQEYEVKQNDSGMFYIECDEGEHRLTPDVHGYIGFGAKAA